MLNRLRPTRLLLLLTHTISPITMSRNRSLPNLLPVPGRFPRSAFVVVQLVDLLQRHVFRLVDEEVDEGNANKAAAKPNEEDLGL